MTDAPSLPAQMEVVREPSWYWTRSSLSPAWQPSRYHARSKIYPVGFWTTHGVSGHLDDESFDIIGPRIPDPVTLQQHERLEAEIAEMEAGYKNAAELVLTYHGKNERLEAVADAARDLLANEKGDWTLSDRLASALAALDTAAPETPANTELAIAREDVAENTGDPR